MPWGTITLEHALYDKNGKFKWFAKDLTDRIEHRPEAYKGYLNTLTDFFDLHYCDQMTNSPDLAFFSYVQANGGNKRNNVMLFNVSST